MCLSLTLPVLGTAIGRCAIVYQVAESPSGSGLVRLEVGRTTMRRPASPSYVQCVAASLRWFFVPECPLYLDVSSALGLSRIDSDDDDEMQMKKIYVLSWKAQARASGICFQNLERSACISPLPLYSRIVAQ